MPLRPHLALFAALMATLSACATPAPSVTPPAPEDVGNRIRILIRGRDVESITSADYFLYVVIRTPDGRHVGTSTLLPESVSSPGSALSMSVQIERRCGLPDLEIVEGTDEDPQWSTEIVLPEGYSMSCEPGTFYAYRIIDYGKTMAADRAPEVRVQASSKDGSRFYDVPPSDGPVIRRAATPPDWPPATLR